MSDRIEALRIVTHCRSVDELVAAFEPYVDDDSCFIPNRRARPVGTEIAFSIRLADGTPVLRGAGVVRDMWTDDANPFGRPGMRLTISRIVPQNRALYARLKERPRDTTSAIPISRLMEKTERAEVLQRHIKTVQDFALEDERRKGPSRPPPASLRGMRPITRPMVPAVVPVVVRDRASSQVEAIAVAPLLWRWWIGVVAFALIVAMLLMR